MPIFDFEAGGLSTDVTSIIPITFDTYDDTINIIPTPEGNTIWATCLPSIERVESAELSEIDQLETLKWLQAQA